MKSIQLLLLASVSCVLFNTIAANPGGQVLGPGGGGGQFFPTLNANDPDNILVRCDMSGSFITRDNARSWKMVNFGKTPLDYEIDPSNENTLYVAAQGLFRSMDKGETWEIVYPLANDIRSIQHFGDHADPEIFLKSGERTSEVCAIRVDPEDSDHVWIGLMNGTVCFTRDGCQSWQVLDGSAQGTIIRIFPGCWWESPDEVLVAGTHSLSLMKEGSTAVETRSLPEETIRMYAGGLSADGRILLYAQSSSAVYTSWDQGESWGEAVSGTFKAGLRLTSLDACEGDPLTAYVGCRADLFGILKTTNGGSSWDWVYKVVDNHVVADNYENAWLDESYGPDWRGNPIGLGVSPVDPDVCYASDFGSTYRTLNGGDTWEQVYSRKNQDGSFTSRGLDVTTCYGVHFDPFDEEHLFVSYTDIGAFQSFDGGNGWEHAISGIPNGWDNTCYWMVFDPAAQGRAWSVWGNKHDLPRHKMFRHGRLLERAKGGVAVSRDSGRTWSPVVGTGLPEDAVCTHILLDETSPTGQRILYVTAFQRGIYKSIDSGESWIRLPDVPGTNRNYWRLAQQPGGDLFVMVARDRKGDRWKGDEFPGGLFRSSDGGNTWEGVTLPRGYDFPHDLTFDPEDPDVLYLSMWAGSFEGGDPDTSPVGGGLLTSRDGGATWRQIFDPTSFVYSATPDPRGPDRLYLVTFEGAAFYSKDKGVSWNLIKGFDFKWSHRPVPDPEDKEMLYITTFGGGLWHGPVEGGEASPLINVDPRWRWHRVLGEE